MKIASWNVNSIRVRLPHVLEWLNAQQPDILGLQELKLPTEAFPKSELEEIGYRSVAFGQKTYNGVALISNSEPANVVCGMPNFPDEQSRVIAATYGDVRVVNVYVPNGQSLDSDKFEYKLAWLDALREYLREECSRHSSVAVMGDFNIAPEDQDVHDPEAWRGKVLCSDQERGRLEALFQDGFEDTFRLFDQPDDVFSWWDYRAAGYRRNRGLRIDLILLTSALTVRCQESYIDEQPRKLERPSDHAPVCAVLD